MKTQENNFNCNKKSTKHNFFYSLDCRSGEGLVNLLLIELKKISNLEFKFYRKFILEKCINVNRSFSDAVEFLSIWVEKSPRSLFNQLKDGELKQFFNRTEYDHDGNQWCFPKLLQIFSKLIEKNQVGANEILDYLFETFDFFSMPEIFVREVIGYDRLRKCTEECPPGFKQALILKMHSFLEENKMIDIGSNSRKYLNTEIQAIDNDIKRVKTGSVKQTEGQALIDYIKNGGLFIYPSIKHYNPSASDTLTFQFNH